MPTQPASRPFVDREALVAALPHVLDAPGDGGTLEMIVIRPAAGERRAVESAALSAARGVHDAKGGDHWARGCWLTTEDGRPHPDVQICMMSARMIAAIAGPRENWAPAGDNLFLDADLGPDAMPPGTRFALGGAELVVTDQPHAGCESFIARYGRDACVFVNTGAGKAHNLRGIYARVLRDGRVNVGDRIRKLG